MTNYKGQAWKNIGQFSQDALSVMQLDPLSNSKCVASNSFCAETTARNKLQHM